jgi:putative transposase
VNGRKRHVLVDVLGLILAVVVHPANIQDRDGARLVFERVRGLFPRLKKVWADGAYAGQLVDWVKSSLRWVLEIVSRPAEARGFEVLPRRWIVERTFGWFNRYRRLSKDYEFLTDTSETMIYIAMIHLMVRRLRPCEAT